ncbi:MAG TPA: hypothetical protein DIW37_01440, partial [Chryseobacterium sp.]|nr:hypothetical protein [Chryseobacterium sp.]
MENKYPQKPGLDFIMKQAFFYWNKTLIFQLMFSVLYFAIFFTSMFFFAEKFGVLEQQQQLIEAYQNGMDAYLAKAAELGQT